MREAEKIEDVLDELRFSSALTNPPAFKVIPEKILFRKKDKRFSGIEVNYKGVRGFVPKRELRKPYHQVKKLRELIRKKIPLKVCLRRIDENRSFNNSEHWETPIFSMFISESNVGGFVEINPGVFDVKLKEGDEISLAEDIKVKIIKTEYHTDEKRPKSVVLRISAPSKYPIVRPEYREKDIRKWDAFIKYGNKISFAKVRRFFYKKKGKDAVEVKGYKLIIFPFFSKHAKRLYELGYVCNLRIVYPQEVF